MSVFLIAKASAKVLPLTHSVARLELAMALPQPNVLNFASSITPLSSLTLIWSFITSPHSGAPTRPVPTLGSSWEERRRFADCCSDRLPCLNMPLISPQWGLPPCSQSRLRSPMHRLQVDTFFGHFI